MKRKAISSLLFFSIFSLSSCGPTSSVAASTVPIPPTTLPPLSSTVVPPSSVIVPISTLSEIRSATVGSLHKFAGVVVQHFYTGQSTSYITGFFIANDSGCIYVFGEDAAKSVKVGDEIVVQGTKAYYIPQTDTGAAASTGYAGQLQLTAPTILERKSEGNAIPAAAIKTATHITEIQKAPVNVDISNTLYTLKGVLTKETPADYSNYYLTDINRVDSLSFYTQSNGKDYTWLDSYLGKLIEITIVAINSKPGNAIWRGYPVSVKGETTIPDADEARFSAERAASLFNDSYANEIVVAAPKIDPLVSDVSLSYESTSDLVEIVSGQTEVSVKLKKPATETEIVLKVTATYKTVVASATKKIILGKSDAYETISIAEAIAKPSKEVVTIGGIVARKTYKSGTTDPLGAFIVDKTASILIFNGADFLSTLTNVQEGNRIIIKGTIDRFISENTLASGYTGDMQIQDIEVLFNDGGINEIPADSIKEQTISWIASQPVSNNIQGNIFKVKAIVNKSAGNYGAYSVMDPTNSEKTLSIYSQQNAAEWKWLEEYIGKTVIMYVGVQNLQVRKDGSANWRSCAIKVLETVI